MKRKPTKRKRRRKPVVVGSNVNLRGFRRTGKDTYTNEDGDDFVKRGNKIYKTFDAQLGKKYKYKWMYPKDYVPERHPVTNFVNIFWIIIILLLIYVILSFFFAPFFK